MDPLVWHSSCMPTTPKQDVKDTLVQYFSARGVDDNLAGFIEVSQPPDFRRLYSAPCIIFRFLQ